MPLVRQQADSHPGDVFALFYSILCLTQRLLLGYLALWERFMSQIAPMAARLPYMTSQGNHERDWGNSVIRNATLQVTDTGGRGPTPYATDLKYGGTPSGGECGVPMQARFRMPTPGGVSQDDGWYSFDQGSVHFVVINTEMHCGPRTRQLVWIEEDLSGVNRNITPWVVLMGHRQMYGDSYNCPPGPWQVCCVDDTSLCRGDNSHWRDCHLMAPLVPVLGVSIGINRGCRQNDSLADG